MRRHELYVLQMTDGHYNSDGDWVDGETVELGPYVCDAVPTTKSTDVIYEDGEDHHFTFICYMHPSLVDTVTKGMHVKLLREGQEYDLKVINTRPYKHQLKVYIG